MNVFHKFFLKCFKNNVIRMWNFWIDCLQINLFPTRLFYNYSH